ncbi:acyl-CoA dehydrogenase family protein [Microbacterium sp. A84]|uniref:acyl-CoA dehydrogenase family protein n=1 Tax=Microbacterium sp. A84 TaxID=3450715 RepID=UPI003F41EDE4
MSELSAGDVADFRASTRAAIAGSGESLERVRGLMATKEGFSREEWLKIERDLELVGISLAADYGGSELSHHELGYAMEEAGYAAACLPLFGTAALAVPLLQALEDADVLHELAPDLISGRRTATVALAEADGVWELSSVATTAARDGNQWRLSGQKSFVVDGATADVVLVVARDASGFGVYLIDQGAGVTKESLVTLDQTRKMATLALDGAAARRIGTGDSSSAIEAATAVSRALLAAEQVGGAQRCLDMTVEYVKTRFQFGRAIGSFQAIKQRLADMLIQVESARSAAYAALRAVSDGDADSASIARIAGLTASEAFEFAAAQTIQLHGGIGFTWEHDAHIFYKRAKTSAKLLGSVDSHVERLSTFVESKLE